MRRSEITAARELASTARSLYPDEVRDLQSLTDCLLAERERLRTILQKIAGPFGPGHPYLLGMYHKAGLSENEGHLDVCKMPNNCLHCKLVREARAALAESEGE